MSCVIYLGCKMTGRDKQEQIRRAKYVSAVLSQYGLTVISPVLVENVENTPGPLINNSIDHLKRVWRADKDILRHQAHVMVWDNAQDKSFGAERELGLMRYSLWKPVVLLMPDLGLSVASIEDDYITDDPHIAGAFIRHKFGTRWKRVKWRLQMLNRTLVYWLWTQILAWG